MIQEKHAVKWAYFKRDKWCLKKRTGKSNLWKNTSMNTFNTRTDMAEDGLHGMENMWIENDCGLMSGSNPSKWPRPVKSNSLRRQREHWVKCKATSGTRRSEAGLGLYPRVATLTICSHLYWILSPRSLWHPSFFCTTWSLIQLLWFHWMLLTDDGDCSQAARCLFNFC